MKLFTDGASRGNPGEAGGGIVLIDGEHTIEHFKYFGKKTNNQSEYLALIEGLKLAVKQEAKKLDIFMDSQLIVRQVRGEYKVKNSNMQPLHADVMGFLERIPSWTITHIKREENKRADWLSNQAIDMKEIK